MTDLASRTAYIRTDIDIITTRGHVPAGVITERYVQAPSGVAEKRIDTRRGVVVATVVIYKRVRAGGGVVNTIDVEVERA